MLASSQQHHNECAAGTGGRPQMNYEDEESDLATHVWDIIVTLALPILIRIQFSTTDCSNVNVSELVLNVIVFTFLVTSVLYRRVLMNKSEDNSTVPVLLLLPELVGIAVVGLVFADSATYGFLCLIVGIVLMSPAVIWNVIAVAFTSECVQTFVCALLLSITVSCLATALYSMVLFQQRDLTTEELTFNVIRYAVLILACLSPLYRKVLDDANVGSPILLLLPELVAFGTIMLAAAFGEIDYGFVFLLVGESVLTIIGAWHCAGWMTPPEETGDEEESASTPLLYTAIDGQSGCALSEI